MARSLSEFGLSEHQIAALRRAGVDDARDFALEFYLPEQQELLADLLDIELDHAQRLAGEAAREIPERELEALVREVDNAYLVRNSQPEETGGGAFLVRNSWGPGWAKQNPLAEMCSAGPGYAIIPYLYIERYCFEAFSIAVPAGTRPSGTRRLADAASAAGKSWWERTRGRVVTSARRRLVDSVR